MIIAVVAKITPDQPKVPPLEQSLSAGCAAHGMLLAAQALGLWRDVAHRPLRLRPHGEEGPGPWRDDELVAFLYLGQMGGRHKPLPERDPADFVERWT